MNDHYNSHTHVDGRPCPICDLAKAEAEIERLNGILDHVRETDRMIAEGEYIRLTDERPVGLSGPSPDAILLVKQKGGER